jgi:hypothetical protein
MIAWITIDECQVLLRLGDIGHGSLGEGAAAFELPYQLLLQLLPAHQSDVNEVGRRPLR